MWKAKSDSWWSIPNVLVFNWDFDGWLLGLTPFHKGNDHIWTKFQFFSPCQIIIIIFIMDPKGEENLLSFFFEPPTSNAANSSEPFGSFPRKQRGTRNTSLCPLQWNQTCSPQNLWRISQHKIRRVLFAQKIMNMHQILYTDGLAIPGNLLSFFIDAEKSY